MRPCWLVVIALTIHSLLLGVVNSNSAVSCTISSGRHISTDTIDVGLYSRQLLVYGKSSQQKLSNSKAIVFGSGLAIDEITKNLALAGVGNIILVSSSNPKGEKRITGDDPSLAVYLKSLNPSINVRCSKFRSIIGLISCTI
jgi:hypothetical protein